jgi:PAS domain S-box-containing protein
VKPVFRSRSLLLLGLLVSNLLVLALVAYSLVESRQNHERRADLLTQNIVGALELSLSNTVSRIDIALRAVVDELERQLAAGGQVDGPATQAVLERHAQRLPEVEAFRVADAEGRVFLGPGLRADQPVSWADREYFVYHREHADGRLQISPPRIGRTSGKPIIGFAQRYNYPDGRFAGVVSAPVAVDQFVNLLNRFDLGERGVAVLRYIDRSLIARVPILHDELVSPLGNTNISQDLKNLLDSGVTAAHYRATNASDGIPRAFAMRRVDSASMIAIVGLATDDYLADWRRECNVKLAIGGSFLLLSLLLGGGLWRRMAAAERQGAEIAEREAQLRSVIEAVPDAVLLKDGAGRWLIANSVCLSLFGIGNADWQGLSDEELARRLPGGMAPGAPGAASDEAAWAAGRLSHFEESTVDAEGRPHHYEIAKVPLADAVGGRLGMVAVMRDVSERKAAELELDRHRNHLEQLVGERSAALAEIEARASHILQSSADGLFGIDAQGRLTFINRAGCALLGYTSEQLIGRQVHGIIHHSRPDGSPYDVRDCPTLASLRDGETVRVDNEVFLHADGHPLSVMYASHPLLRDGRIVGAVVSFVDIAPQRAAAQAREQALLAAERLDGARREFIANMSHELRTPLNGILGFAEIGLRAADDPERVRLAFSRILTSGRHLLAIVSNLLDFSRLEAGRLHLDMAPCSPRDLLERAVGRIQERAAAKKIVLDCQLTPEVPANWIGDARRIEQILDILLSNAVKFSHAGCIRAQADLIQGELSFRIEDSGMGIAAEQFEKLFNPFQQLDGSSTRRFGGSGLGLAIGKRLAELMGGNILVSSQPGIGSCFELRLPLRVASGAVSSD